MVEAVTWSLLTKIHAEKKPQSKKTYFGTPPDRSETGFGILIEFLV
jgi:hypothetical protein